ncbi:[Fructose-bisphosphate aldolase]-lysine N-methyltransferase [Carex littledalei]|uniref:[Fructose-bisphosphate aldolase]-lysine N-methyltransferase n=1 Tax=Carex littledalei TaxID=544730 RepID=A0A833QUT1_9POAL|nr:[Fructose-bisphosphate aldolase]-lysine N-methyltransferase [Carex littledalei]
MKANMEQAKLSFCLPPLTQDDQFYAEKKNLLDARDLRYEFELPNSLSTDEILKIFDQIIQTARLIHMDEIELYFVEDEDFGPFSPRNEIGSLNLILRIIDTLLCTASHQAIQVLRELRNVTLSKVHLVGTQSGVVDHMMIDESSNNIEEDDSLLRWAKNNGVQSKLNIGRFKGAGRGLIASDDLSIGDAALEIPESLIISEDLIFQSEMYNAVKDLEIMTSDTMLTLWTMRERFNPDSKFKIYFDKLPENFNTGLSFGIEALAELEGTLLFEELMQSKEHLRQQYDMLFPMLFSDYPDIFKKEIYTWDRFLWACELFYSNSMKVVFSDGKLKTCLVPVAGLLNHSLCPHILHYGRVDPLTKYLKFPLSRPCERGQQCYLSYGSYSSSHFLTFYGFVPKGDNYYDFIPLDFDAPDGDGSAKSQHMVRGTWLSKSNGPCTYGLPHKLVAHLRSALNCGDLMDSAADRKETDREVLEMMLSIFNPMLEELGASDGPAWEIRSWDVMLALEFKELQRVIISSVVASCYSGLELMKL